MMEDVGYLVQSGYSFFFWNYVAGLKQVPQINVNTSGVFTL